MLLKKHFIGAQERKEIPQTIKEFYSRLEREDERKAKEQDIKEKLKNNIFATLLKKEEDLKQNQDLFDEVKSAESFSPNRQHESDSSSSTCCKPLTLEQKIKAAKEEWEF